MLTLTLDGQPVDLPADAAVALSYRSSDLRRLDTREASFSETFALPLTARNARVLGTPHALSSQTSSPYRRLPAVLRANGLPVLRGVAVLEASELGYEITLLDDTADLFGRVGDKALRTLDLSALDHAYSAASTQAAQGRATGYTYALADEGPLTYRAPAQSILWYELTQAVYYRAVLEAITAAALPGYQLTGSLLTDATFAAAAFPRATPTPRLREAARTPYAVQALREVSTREHDSGSGKSYPLIPFPKQLTGSSTHYTGTAFTTPPYPADIVVTARLLVRADAEFVPTGLNLTNTVAAVRLIDATDAVAVSVHEQVLVEGVAALFASLVRQQPPGLTVVEFSYTLPACAPNRLLAVQLRLENGAGLTIGAGSTIGFVVGERTYAGAPVHLDASLPDISQADVLKLICNQFGALLRPDSTTRTLRVDCFNDLERNRARAVEWSTKLDYASRPRLEYRVGEYAQQNTFAYKPAPVAYAALLLGAPLTVGPGTGTLAVPNLTLPPKAEAYAAPVLLPLAHPALNNTLPLCWLPFTLDPTPNNPPALYDPAAAYAQPTRVRYGQQVWRSLLVLNLAATVPGTPPRLTAVPVKPVVGPTSPLVAWALEEAPAAVDELPTCALVAPAPFAAALLVRADAPDVTQFAPLTILTRAGLSFSDLLLTYHEGTARILNRVQLLTAYFSLNAADINNLDFSVPITLNIPWVAGYGALRGTFYLNLIDQFRPGQPAPVRVELLRLGDPIAGLAADATPLPARPDRLLLTEAGPPLLTETPVYLEQERP